MVWKELLKYLNFTKKEVIGFWISFSGTLLMTLLTGYILISGLNFVIQESSSLSSVDLVEELLIIVCKSIISAIVGIVMTILGLKIATKKKKKKKKKKLFNNNGSGHLVEGKVKSNMKTGTRSKRMAPPPPFMGTKPRKK